MEKKKPPLSIQTEVNVLLVMLTIAALATRLWSLENPRAVVFDEIHFGQFAALYLKRVFFFDVHPPLGKLLYAGVGYLSGWDADFVFEKIGAEYPASVPIWHLRLLPALLGAALCPAVYQIIVELGYSHWSATLAGCLILFDNALLTQSRFILLDPILLFFSAMSILSLLKFRNVQDRVFSLWWWIWLTCTGIFMVFTVSVKYTGIFTALIVAVVLAIDFWKLIGKKTIPMKTLGHHLLAYLGLILVLPMVIYAAIFYIHLSILNSSGPHDDMMTSAFQATLIGGLSSITEGQPLEVAYGSQITLRHTHGQPCWLHSHDSLYPIRYPDGRGSSAQQQVTCYPFKDINNWWIVKNPTRPSLVVDNPPRAVKDGDIIQLIHGITGRSLNSHDVAAPVSPYCMEVTCYIDYNISYPAQNLWKVEVANKDSDGESWKSIQSQVRLIHVNTSQALMITGQQLPEWGFHQFEVATDHSLTQDSTIWNVEEHKYTRLPDQTEVEFLIDSEPSTAKLTFWEKFLELQWKMLTAMSEVTQEHRYSSEPIEWPLMARGIAYWMDYDTNAQIHFLGNPVIWWTATAAILIYVAFTVVMAIRWRRKCFDMEAEMWHQYIVSGVLLFGGWFLHYIPFFVLDRTLFLHHYLPALLFKIMLLCLILELLCQHVIKSTVLQLGFVLPWCSLILLSFVKFSPFSYGNKSLSEEELESCQWLDSWGFLQHGKLSH